MKSIFTILFTIMILALLNSCSTQNNFKNKFYDFSIKPSSKKIRPYVYGYVKEFNKDHSVPYPIINVDGNDKIKYKGDINGKFYLIIDPGKYRFLAKGYPYPPQITKAITLTYGDTVLLNFYLPNDTTKLIEHKIH